MSKQNQKTPINEQVANIHKSSQIMTKEERLLKPNSSHSLVSKGKISKSASNGSFIEVIGAAANVSVGNSYTSKGK